ncbi:alpha/beta hydrolase family protein [Qipengyuania qiaonensis]|uniref:Alpha/beta fold hydrolase n=1 Tax=Qipengyuania qiaonensis TaxID=2867240 RepID=A0ABS7J847_9SPHN|nr:alpha/beta fold hydrolase [Qipengyuania qiaonensis]MBX7482145.1 alpha/beta fold hydrolase [Qipengyuania qiaonensis]
MSSVATAQQVSEVPLSEEVRYPSDPDTVIAATLERPPSTDERLLPVVVIISGTGPWTRGGWENMRATLHAAGFATLMYDKRGLGQSTGTFVDTIPAMQRDVAAAVAFLRTRADIDHERIALMGISQGAVAAPLVASEDPAIAAVVMLSGPVGPRGELFLGILRGHLTNAGKTSEQINRVTAAVAAWMNARSEVADESETANLRKAVVDAFAEVGFPQDQAENFVAALDDEVVLSMYDVASDRALERLRMPTLAIYGSKDEVIAPYLSIEAATVALQGNPDAIVVAIPGMTHELQRATPMPSSGTAPKDGTMPVVTELVGNWLARRLGTMPRGR